MGETVTFWLQTTLPLGALYLFRLADEDVTCFFDLSEVQISFPKQHTVTSNLQ